MAGLVLQQGLDVVRGLRVVDVFAVPDRVQQSIGGTLRVALEGLNARLDLQRIVHGEYSEDSRLAIRTLSTYVDGRLLIKGTLFVDIIYKNNTASHCSQAEHVGLNIGKSAAQQLVHTHRTRIALH